MAFFDDIPAELTDPAAGDFLLARDISVVTGEIIKRLPLSQIGMLALANIWLTTQTFNATAIFAGGVRSGSINLSDDTFGTINMVTGTGAIFFYPGAAATHTFSGLITFINTPAVQLIGGGSNFVAATGALGGATGTDGRWTVSPHTDSKIYVENRTGSSRTMKYFLWY